MLKNNAHKLVGWLLFIVIVGAYLLMAVWFPSAYIVATYEDLVGEWAQVFFFVSTLVLSARIALQKSQYRWFFAVLSVACFYVAGEEISWGQRVFDIETPEFFKQHNLQNETNLHNFFTGPISSLTKTALEYLIASGLVAYGLVYPLTIRFRWKLALWFDGKGLPAPPLYLWPFFVLSAFLELGFLRFNEAEIAEVLIPLSLSIMALNYSQNKSRSITSGSEWDALFSRRVARQTLLLVAGVLLIAVGTTVACYVSPGMEEKISSRYLNGMEKFAGRYERYGQWQVAADLYLQIHQKEPERTSILRKLFKCHQELGDKALAMSYLKKAEQLDITYLKGRPESISANLSLARTYRLMGDAEKNRKHLKSGLRNAVARVDSKPESASSAYWLGKALEANGDYAAAIREYRRAVGLRPGYLKYQKAVVRLHGR